MQLNFSFRQIDNGYFLANTIGQWHFLSRKQFDDLNRQSAGPRLLDELEERYLVLTEKNRKAYLKEKALWDNNPHQERHQIVIVHLTQRCNLTCQYCHSAAISPDAKGRDLSPELAERVCNFVATMQKDQITIAFQGGEPALQVDEIELICKTLLEDRRNRSKEIRFGVTTNGTIHSTQFLQLISRYQIATTVSLDGPQDIHDSLRKDYDGAGSFQRALKFKELLREHAPACASGSIMVLTRDGISRVQEIIDQYIEFGQSVLRLKAVTRLGKAKSTWDQSSITFEEYWDAYKIAHQYMIDHYAERRNITVEHSVLTFLRKLFEKRNVGDVDTKNPCGIVNGIVSIDVDGRIYACHETKRQKKFLLGSVSQDAESVLTSARAVAIRSMTDLSGVSECNQCAYYSYCTPCPAHNFQATGDPTIRPYESWECKKTIALGDLVLSNFQQNASYYVDSWKTWRMSHDFANLLSTDATRI